VRCPTVVPPALTAMSQLLLTWLHVPLRCRLHVVTRTPWCALSLASCTPSAGGAAWGADTPPPAAAAAARSISCLQPAGSGCCVQNVCNLVSLQTSNASLLLLHCSPRRNQNGQLGHGNTNDLLSPQRVQGLQVGRVGGGSSTGSSTPATLQQQVEQRSTGSLHMLQWPAMCACHECSNTVCLSFLHRC
jgi:hypothetical protein